jgi:glucose/arabinose dehydrogenase
MIYFICFLLQTFSVPEGFSYKILTEKTKGARSLAISGNNVFVGTRSKCDVYHLELTNDFSDVKTMNVIAQDLNMPNGVAIKYNNLYVAEVNRILVFNQISNQIESKKYTYQILRSDFPSDSHHGWKYLKIGPDDHLYVPVGAPCNICELTGDYGSLFRVSLDGKTKEKLATGIRNTVGFDWHPLTKKMWFSDNGRDWLGDDSPPEEINLINGMGEHFGYPYLHGKNIPDPEFGGKSGNLKITLPVLEIQAHSAALGMTFYRGDQFPQKYKNQLFVALHGSWNRSKKVGYKVIVVHLDKDQTVKYVEDFMTGFLSNETVNARPVDIAELSDGSLLITDDYSGKIFRVRYGK